MWYFFLRSRRIYTLCKTTYNFEIASFQISSRLCIKCIFLFPRWIYRYHYLMCTQQVNSIPRNLKTLKKFFYQSIAFFMHFSCSRSVVIWQCWKNISIKNLDFRSSRCGFRRRTRGRHDFSVQKTCCFGGHASLSHLARCHGVQKSGDRGQVCGSHETVSRWMPVKDKLIQERLRICEKHAMRCRCRLHPLTCERECAYTCARTYDPATPVSSWHGRWQTPNMMESTQISLFFLSGKQAFVSVEIIGDRSRARARVTQNRTSWARFHYLPMLFNKCTS